MLIPSIIPMLIQQIKPVVQVILQIAGEPVEQGPPLMVRLVDIYMSLFETPPDVTHRRQVVKPLLIPVPPTIRAFWACPDRSGNAHQARCANYRFFPISPLIPPV